MLFAYAHGHASDINNIYEQEAQRYFVNSEWWIIKEEYERKHFKCLAGKRLRKRKIKQERNVNRAQFICLVETKILLLIVVFLCGWSPRVYLIILREEKDSTWSDINR